MDFTHGRVIDSENHRHDTVMSRCFKEQISTSIVSLRRTVSEESSLFSPIDQEETANPLGITALPKLQFGALVEL